MPDSTADRRSTDDRLSRRYRRLLLAYPRWHRRRHGADMLTTMLDAAADDGGGRAATVRDAATLVLDGLRCRLRVRGAAARLLAAALAVVGAGVVAAAAGWCVWQVSAAPWPSVDDAVALAAPVVPPEPPVSVSRRDTPFGPWLTERDSVLLALLGSPEQRAGGVRLSYLRPPVVDRAARFDLVSDRLRADGWRTSSANGWLVADRDGLRVAVTFAGFDERADEMIVAVRPTPPRSAQVLAGTGAALGALLGWVAAAAAIARCRHGQPSRRIGAAALATAGALGSLPAGLLNLIATAAPDVLTREGPAPPWVGYGFVLARPAAAIGVTLLVAAYFLSTDRRTAPPGPAHRPTALVLAGGRAALVADRGQPGRTEAIVCSTTQSNSRCVPGMET